MRAASCSSLTCCGFVSVPGSNQRPRIHVLVRLVELRGHHVRVSLRVRHPVRLSRSTFTDTACLASFPPFVSNSVSPCTFLVHSATHPPSCDISSFVKQRHVTRQKILNWKQSLRFPSRPKVSHEAVNLMEQLLCEPEDRLGSQASSSVSRPNSMIVQARRSGFITPQGTMGSVDGAHLIKVCTRRVRARFIADVLTDTSVVQRRRLGEYPQVPGAIPTRAT